MAVADTNPRLTPELEQTLRRYVTGALDESVRPELEERLVTEPDVFEALGVVEDELIEEYLDGVLHRSERQAFERCFLTSPARLARLRLAKSLRARASTVAAGPPVRERVPPPARLRQPRFLALAAALLASLVGNVWLASHRPGRPGAADDVTPVARVEPAARAAAAAQAQAEAAVALELEREARSRAEARAVALQEELRRRRSGIATFALAAGALRSAGRLTRVTLPAGAQAVRLHLELEQDDYPLYRATLVDAEGEELWTASQLRSEKAGERVVVALVLPATSIVRGDYQVRLSGGATADRIEAVATYAFRSGAPE